MIIRLEKLIDFNRNQNFNYYFEINNSKRLAKSIYLDYEFPVKFVQSYIILQINDYNFILGAIPEKTSSFIKFLHPKKLDLKLYNNGNFAIFKKKSHQKTKPIFYYDQKHQTLEYDQNYFFLPYSIFTGNYHFQEIEDSRSKISKLLTRPEFSEFCQISYDTLRSWNEKGKLLPLVRKKKGRMYFSKDQILQVQKLQNARYQTKDVYSQLLSTLKDIEINQVLHIKFLKNSISDYSDKHYYTLQKSLNKLLDLAIVSRVRPGYYRLLKSIDY